MKTPLPTIIYEDDTLIAYDKPSGLLAAPDRWDSKLENLMTMVHERVSPTWFNLHRLDRDASGVMLLAKTRAALRTLTRTWTNGTGAVHKEYRALVLGVPAENEGTIRAKLSADPHHPGRMRTTEAHNGKATITNYKVLERWRQHAWLAVEPETGRTHQIRVHLYSIGAPIVADSFYGPGTPLRLSSLKPNYKFKFNVDERPLMNRLALHAWRLTVPHPVTGVPLTIEAPLPKAFEVSLKYLRRYAAVRAPLAP